MYLGNQAESLRDEFTLGFDSTSRSSQFQIQLGLTTYGSLGPFDSSDYYQFTLGVGSYELVVSTDRLNGSSSEWGAPAGDFTVNITNALGSFIGYPNVPEPDGYTQIIKFNVESTVTLYVQVGSYAFNSFDYAATIIPFVPDTTPPAIVSESPADESTGVSPLAPISITFNEAIQRGSGSIQLQKGDGTFVSSQSSISGSTLTITPLDQLADETAYRVVLQAGSITDLTGNGIAADSSYNFTTGDSVMRPVTDAERLSFPGQAVGVILAHWSDGTNAEGTCAMVGRNDVLTATHVINKPDHGGLCTSLEIYFGADVNAANAPPQSWSYKLTSDFKWVSLTFPDQVYTDFNDETNSPSEAQYDVAMIGLSVPVGDTTGWFGMDPGSNSAQTLEQYGYPASEPGMVKGAIAVTHNPDYNMYEAGGDPMGSGASGGPLVAPGNYVVGVRSTGNTSGYASWADIGSVYSDLNQFMQQDDAVMSDTTPPVLVSISPAAGSANVSSGQDFVFTFSEPVIRGSGTITLTGTYGSFSSFNVASSSAITVSGNTLTLHTSLANSETYTMTVPTGMVSDFAANASGGGGTYTFTVRPLGIYKIGFSTNDTLTGSLGDDTFDAGDGTDYVAYNYARSQYTIHQSGAAWIVSGLEGDDTLYNVERLAFADEDVALDITGNAGQAYRLYQAAFNRQPDIGGLGYQMTALDSGLSLVQVAGNFIASPEFQRTYGNVDDTQFVTLLYANVLHRAPDSGGLQYHLNELDTGQSRAMVLTHFSESPENQANVLGSISSGMVYTL